MEPEDIPVKMVETYAQTALLSEDLYPEIRILLAAALSVCDVHLETGIVFDDEPDYLHVGSSHMTEIMSRSYSGRSQKRHSGKRWVIRTPVERDEANDTAG